MNKLAILEGLLFVVGDDGLTLKQICDIMELSLEEGRDLILDLKNTYDDENRGIRINILGDRFKLSTKKEHREYYKKLVETPENNTLSQAALETLAIVAYNEPLTRIEVDEIRGVNSREMLRKLVAKGLVKEEGRRNLPGRPILYATTNEFLDYFGLSSKDQLPKFEQIIEEEVDDTDLYHSKYVETEKNTDV